MYQTNHQRVRCYGFVILFSAVVGCGKTEEVIVDRNGVINGKNDENALEAKESLGTSFSPHDLREYGIVGIIDAPKGVEIRNEGFQVSLTSPNDDGRVLALTINKEKAANLGEEKSKALTKGAVIIEENETELILSRNDYEGHKVYDFILNVRVGDKTHRVQQSLDGDPPRSREHLDWVLKIARSLRLPPDQLIDPEKHSLALLEWRRFGVSFDLDTETPYAQIDVDENVNRALALLEHVPQVQSISLSKFGDFPSPPVELEHLSKLPMVRELQMNGSFISDKELSQVSSLPDLEELVIQKSAIKGEGLKHLSNLKKLQKLDLSYNSFGAQNLQFLAELASLKELFLNETPADDESMKFLSGLTHIWHLELNETQVTDKGLKNLGGFEDLRWLRLGSNGITGSGLESQAGKALETLDLSKSSANDGGLKVVSKLLNLDRLDLDHTKVNDAGLANLAPLQNLSTLDLAGTSVTDNGLDSLANLQKLHHLDLSKTQVTDDAIPKLSSIKSLMVLYLTETSITDKAKAQLVQQNPDLELKERDEFVQEF